MGMFDQLLGAKAAPQTASTRAPEGGAVAGATPEQIKAAIARLVAKGVKPNQTNIAEEIALGGDEEQAAPAAPRGEPMRGKPVMGGGQPSPEMMQAVKAQQDARNRAVLERAMAERRRMSGAR